MKQILVNAIITPDGTRLESRHRHDFNQHVDTTNGKLYAVDGGLDYLRRINDGPYIEDSVYSDDPHGKIRQEFRWKSFGKNGELYPEGVIRPVCDLDSDHIVAILETQTHLPHYIQKIFVDELSYRLLH